MSTDNRILETEISILSGKLEMLKSDFKEIADALGCDVKDSEAMLNKIALLQGAAGKSPAIQNGLVLVPAVMTPEQMRAVQIKSELGSYAATNLSGAYDLFREFWDVAVTAVLQQE
ncbi:hypothetical protein [Enterobacter asburiae]|uniref:hypothetical protein n=1 Tax=Enterobacter asburiae TaxID=61645 RepID=UPI00192BC343|nr:hypothetical protein [Enterobacter asburiae]MBL5927805.1 hypothetical protein [Enterobacter asburiae]MBL5958592.1 hypothetical protein [Enterobacter asburiae]